MQVKGVSAFILTIGVFLILLSALGLTNSLNTSIHDNSILTGLMIAGLAMLLAVAFFRKRGIDL